MSMDDTKSVPTPELDKRGEIISSGKAEMVQEFIDWLLDEKGLELARWEQGDFSDSLRPYHFGTREQLMADFFGIDLKKIDEEQRALLEAIRS